MNELINKLLNKCNSLFLGKERVVRLTFASILAKGHLLIEDVPGVGKTTLINILAKLMDLPLSRIQLTSDLLPSDILGNLVYDADKKTFNVFQGPIFSNFVLADELNRATPKTQSAFLQAMEEGIVTIDKKNFELPKPFILFATQNPKQLVGTFLLPESQLDRFLMRITIGFPESSIEKDLIIAEKRKDLISALDPIISVDDLVKMQQEVEKIFVSNAIVDYVENILQRSRTIEDNKNYVSYDIYGLSPRAGMAIVDAAKAWAYIEGRDKVLPEDIQEVVFEVIAHRMMPQQEISAKANSIIKEMIYSINVV